MYSLNPTKPYVFYREKLAEPAGERRADAILANVVESLGNNLRFLILQAKIKILPGSDPVCDPDSYGGKPDPGQ